MTEVIVGRESQVTTKAQFLDLQRVKWSRLPTAESTLKLLWQHTSQK